MTWIEAAKLNFFCSNVDSKFKKKYLYIILEIVKTLFQYFAWFLSIIIIILFCIPGSIALQVETKTRGKKKNILISLKKHKQQQQKTRR